jgi:hypothetical protein
MFTPDFYIHLIQSTKRGLTDKIITDPVLNKAAHSFITAQTQFAIMLANNFAEIAKYSTDTITNKWFPKKEVARAEATTSDTAPAQDIHTQGE